MREKFAEVIKGTFLETWFMDRYDEEAKNMTEEEISDWYQELRADIEDGKNDPIYAITY